MVKRRILSLLGELGDCVIINFYHPKMHVTYIELYAKKGGNLYRILNFT